MEDEDRYIGWVSVHRKILKHWIIGDPYYFSAWIMMLLEVNHDREVKKKVIKKQIVECGRGQSIKSIDTWATVFGSKHWTRQKVRTFFKLLEKDGMINQENLSVTTRLTICNFDTYQKKQPSDNQQSNHHVTIRQPSDNHQITTNNNVNNGNNGNNEEEIPPNPLTGGTGGDASKTESFHLDADRPQQPASKPKAKRERKQAQDMPEIPEALNTPAFRSAWADFIAHRKSIRKPMSPKAAELNMRKCITLGPDTACNAIEQSIANGWTGIFEPKAATGVNGSKPKRDPRVPAHIPDHQAQMWILHQETNCYKQFFGDLHANRDVD